MRIATTYTITNHRLHIKRGIIARKTQEARLERVQNVNTDQGVLDRILQVGSVDFDTAGTTDSDFAFRGVAQPEKVVRAVDRAQREHAEEQRTRQDSDARPIVQPSPTKTGSGVSSTPNRSRTPTLDLVREREELRGSPRRRGSSAPASASWRP